MNSPVKVPNADWLLLVATSDELAGLKVAAKQLGLTVTKRTDPFLGKYHRVVRGEELIAVVVKTAMGAVGTNSSTATAWRFQAATQATTVIQVGMAFGVDPRHQKSGDVLVASAVLSYDQRDIRGEGDDEKITYERAVPLPANTDVVARCRQYTDAWSEKYPEVSVQFGTMLSGGSRISSASFRDRLVSDLASRSDDPIIGGEMEAVGLIGVGGRRTPQWAVIKGISDFADGERERYIETTRPIACENAARFALGAILTPPTPIS